MPPVANILYPADYFNKRAPEATFQDEADAARESDSLNVVLFDFDAFESCGLIITAGTKLDALPNIYRGWMMTPEQYTNFYEELQLQGLQLITTPSSYYLCHMFPLAYSSYESLRQHSPKLLATESLNLEADTINRNFSAFMLKDFVKSVNMANFPKKIQCPITQTELDAITNLFIQLRGPLFTRGLVCKEFKELATYQGDTNEWRAFFFQNKLLLLTPHSTASAENPDAFSDVMPPIDFVQQFSQIDSPFYTVDFAQLSCGDWMVVETGDGQVSDIISPKFRRAFITSLMEAFKA